MKSRFIANSAMRKAGNTKNRPEELLVFEIIKYHATYNKLDSQRNIKYTNEQGVIKDSFVDIYFKDKFGEIVLRLMGEYHDELRQQRKDLLQSEYLQRDLYKVIDIWYWDRPGIFLRRERKMYPGELETAYNELRSLIEGLIWMPPKPSMEWLSQSLHRKV